jgi:hypothetical protein
MHLPPLNAFEAVQAIDPLHKRKSKALENAPFTVESALEKPEGGASDGAAESRDEDASGNVEPSACTIDQEETRATPLVEEECDPAMPEDAHDAQEFCAMFGPGGGG